MADRIAVNPAVVRWAALSATAAEVPLDRFRSLDGWMQGTIAPTFNQISEFSSATSVPLGYFFLSEPPVPTLPIADFRVPGERREPSAELLDTLTLCAARQDWYAGYVERAGVATPSFVGSLDADLGAIEAVRAIREHVRYVPGASHRTQQDALRTLIDEIEDAGVLVVVNSVVENNTHRRLDRNEFQGFTLVDEQAPLIFVNGDDTKNAQMFTLAHELAHVFLGAQGLSSATPATGLERESVSITEKWCNAVAAEFLVPLDQVPTALDRDKLILEIERLARRFNVSTLVVLRRFAEKGVLGRDEFWRLYDEESQRVRILALVQDVETSGGGNAYYVMPYRISRRLARAVYSDAYEGGTTFRDAYRLLSTRTTKSFVGLAEHLQVV